MADGVFYAELNEFFSRELSADNYAGVEVRVTPARTEVILKVAQPQKVLGEKGRRIRELTAMVQKRFHFADNAVELYVERITNPGLSAVAQAESLKYKLLNGLVVRRAAYSVLRYVMESGAKGCEVVISGKLRAARAKAMKFHDGFMIHSGQPAKNYVDQAISHVKMRQGVLGVKVKIMLQHDPTGKTGPTKPLPDSITIFEPQEEIAVEGPISEDFAKQDETTQVPQPDPIPAQ